MPQGVPEPVPQTVSQTVAGGEMEPRAPVRVPTRAQREQSEEAQPESDARERGHADPHRNARAVYLWRPRAAAGGLCPPRCAPPTTVRVARPLQCAGPASAQADQAAFSTA